MLDSIEINEEKVILKLRKLKIHASGGPDNIAPRILKEMSNEISVPLTIMFNTSLKSGEVPTDWSRANVIAIHKKDDKRDPDNYRPISLTCIACR